MAMVGLVIVHGLAFVRLRPQISFIMPKVFLSGTFDDLQQERASLLNVFQRIGIASISQEFFGASPKGVIETITQAISDGECFLYVLLLGLRYGSFVPQSELPQELHYPPNTLISFTEMEFDLAVSLGIPRLVYMKRASRRAPGYEVDDSQAPSRKLFIKKILKSRCTCFQFRNKEELAVQAAIDVMKQLTTFAVWQATQGRDYEQ